MPRWPRRTPGFGGISRASRLPAKELIRAGSSPSILSIRGDDAFRTDLVPRMPRIQPRGRRDARPREGTTLATKRYARSPGEGEVMRIVELGCAPVGTRLASDRHQTERSPRTRRFVDEILNDPRTFLPR
jgi:hypothetical protein